MNPEHDSYTPAQVLVLERLTRIETLLTVNNEHQQKTAEKADQAADKAQAAVTMNQHQQQQIDEIRDGSKWAFRMAVGLIFGFCINFVTNIVQGL